MTNLGFSNVSDLSTLSVAVESSASVRPWSLRDLTHSFDSAVASFEHAVEKYVRRCGVSTAQGVALATDRLLAAMSNQFCDTVELEAFHAYVRSRQEHTGNADVPMVAMHGHDAESATRCLYAAIRKNIDKLTAKDASKSADDIERLAVCQARDWAPNLIKDIDELNELTDFMVKLNELYAIFPMSERATKNLRNEIDTLLEAPGGDWERSLTIAQGLINRLPEELQSEHQQQVVNFLNKDRRIPRHLSEVLGNCLNAKNAA